MTNVDLLNRAFTNLYADLRAMADACEDPKRKGYLMGQVSGIEMAISLLDAWKVESNLSQLEEMPGLGAYLGNMKVCQ